MFLGRLSNLFKLLVIMGMAALYLSACAKKEEPCNCGAKNQCASYMTATDTSQALNLVIDETFSTDYQNKILQAVSEWNNYGATNKGRKLFLPRIGAINPATIPELDKCSFSGERNSVFIISDEAAQKWAALKLGANIPGVTIRCSTDGELDRQIIMLNPKILSPEYVVRVTIHELGHSIGLNHSCAEPEDVASDYLACAGLGKEHSYRQAVMFPRIEQNLWTEDALVDRESLQFNDKERAACILR